MFSRKPKASTSGAVPVRAKAKVVIKSVVRTVQPPPRIVPGYIPRPVPVRPQSTSSENASRSGTFKRPLSSTAHSGGSGREAKLPRKEGRVSKPFVESSSESEQEPPRQREESRPVPDRDVSATLDGDVVCVTGAQLVLRNRAAYVEYFVDAADPTRSTLDWAGTEFPEVELQYPGLNASEKFILLLPKGKAEEYNPIEDIVAVIRLTLDYFLTPAQSLALFSHTTASSSSFSAFLSEPNSRSATPTVDSPAPTQALPPLMRVLDRARAKRDGPAFLAALERYNVGIKSHAEEIKLNIVNMKRIAEKVWTKVVAQVYERIVGPEIHRLSQYEAFSDNTYGELLPSFMQEISLRTNLDSDSVFVDLGSGVGNCVVQVALANGCEAYGYENMKQAAVLAQLQTVEAEARFRLWGLNSGRMTTADVDFCNSEEVVQVLRRATVVLVNNEVFSAGLNHRLSLLFLELPSDALIVSLKAFASSFTLSAHTLNSPLAIIDQGVKQRYGKKSVSWKDDGGEYWIGRVDRTRVDKWLAREAKRVQRKKEREEREKVDGTE